MSGQTHYHVCPWFSLTWYLLLHQVVWNLTSLHTESLPLIYNFTWLWVIITPTWSSLSYLSLDTGLTCNRSLSLTESYQSTYIDIIWMGLSVIHLWLLMSDIYMLDFLYLIVKSLSIIWLISPDYYCLCLAFLCLWLFLLFIHITLQNLVIYFLLDQTDTDFIISMTIWLATYF